MTGLLILAVFVALAVMMYLGKMPAILALPVLAIALTLAAGTPFYFAASSADLSFLNRLSGALSDSMQLAFGVVVADGIGRLQVAIFTVMIGGVFGYFLKLSGVGESLVRKVAELAGDKPFSLCLILTLVVTFLFTTLSGLGSVILVANVYFPVLLSLGVPPLIAGSLFLMGFSLGGVFNIVNWAFYTDLLNMSQQDVMKFALPFGMIFFAVLLVFLVVEFKKARLPVPVDSLVKSVLGIILLVALAVWLKSGAVLGESSYAAIKMLFKISMILLFCLPLTTKKYPWLAMLTPFIPISLVLVLGWSINPAFLLGIAFLFIAIKNQPGQESLSGRSRMLIQSMIEGMQSVIPAVAVMMGIGMVLISVNQPPIKASLNPLLLIVLPQSKLYYIAFFTVLAPLALYRGPLNLWGMGSGLMGLMQQTGLLSGFSLLAAFFSTGQIQGVCDPTNTHNVWIANQLKIELNAILTKTLPYIWVLAFLGLILGAYGG